jgi:molybdenum cofactor cytidylyltransferase
VLASTVNKVFVAVGRDAEQLKKSLANRPVTFVANPNPDGDMLSSVRCGLRALPADCAAVLVVLGDQPGCSRELIDGLIRRFHETSRGIVVPIHQVKRGHPLLFAARFCGEVLAQHDATGLRGLLQAHPDEVIGMAVRKATILEDIDTPEDYERKKQP